MSAAPITSDELAAFEAAALPVLADVHRYALRLTGEPADADDLVQTTFLNALRGWRTFRPGTDVRRWLFTICRNAFLSARRRVDRVVHLEEPAMESLQGGIWLEGVPGVAAAFEDAPDVRAALDRAIAALPDDLRLVVLLVDVEGYDYAAAAAHQGIPVGTVRSRLYRARRLLQEALVIHARDAGLLGGTDG